MVPHTHRLLLTAAILLAVACGDSGVTTPPPSPQPKKPTSGLRSTAPTSDVVQVLYRTKALPRNFTASEDIGPAGGTIDIPAAGVHVRFASGAVHSKTRITMTAIAGDVVAYEFQPHG